MKLEDLVKRIGVSGAYPLYEGGVCPICKKELLLSVDGKDNRKFSCESGCSQEAILTGFGLNKVVLLPNWEPSSLPAKELDWKSEKGPLHSLTSLDKVAPEPPSYFWDPYIRLHTVNVIRGDGGVGKTMFLFAVFGAVTAGRKPENMPGILTTGQGSVIYYGAEDDVSEYSHRATLCGCDKRFLHVVSVGSTFPKLSDIGVFREQIRQTGATLIVFDPIQSFLGAGTDMNRANEVRPLLDALCALCREMECTAIIIEHLNKATQQKAQYRGIGTVDITNISRSAIMVGYHPKERGVSVAMQIKANAKIGQPIAFSIDGDGRFSWRGVCDVTEEEVANARRYKKDEDVEVVDPVLSLVLALTEKQDRWIGTSSEILVEGSGLVDCSLLSAEAIGKRLPAIHRELIKHGISWRKLGRKHEFTKIKQVEQGLCEEQT